MAARMKAESQLPPIIVVDDDADDALIFAKALRTAGIKNGLLHFRTGGDAFLFLKQFCPPDSPKGPLPHAMFLDVNMEGLSGFDVLLWARRQPELQRMKIFMLSGANEEFDARIAAKLGADQYLEKFPPPAQLAALLAPRRATADDAIIPFPA
jgi:CheY-like chemotaxis protein